MLFLILYACPGEGYGGDSNFENKEILANHRPSPLFGTLILNMFLAVLAPERRGDI